MCMCDCGNTKLVTAENLSRGYTKSCGCLAKERNKKMSRHGMAGSPEYRSWKSMMARCKNKNHEAYPRYGGRGITVDERWNDFSVFYEDVGPRPGLEYTLDRIDNEKGYCAANCRWATKKEQNNNTRSNVLVAYQGRTITIAELSNLTGIPRNLLYARKSRGWSDSDLTLPPETKYSSR